MYAIVEIAGLQYKVEQDQKLYVNHLQSEIGEELKFERVLLKDDNGSISVGAPVIEGLAVFAKVLEHAKGDKVIVFKKKRRKGYKVKNGHRQQFTRIQILSLGAAGSSSKSTSKTKKEVKTEVAQDPVNLTSEKVKPKKESSKKLDLNDLKLIEGIGPKVEQILNDNKIYSLNDLMNADIENLKEILKNEGGIYVAMDPTTWPEQSKLAVEGKIEELEKLQQDLKGGRRV